MKGLFIDLDGTLAHSLPAMYQAYRLFLQRFGGEGNPDEFAELNGPPLAAIVASLGRKYGLDKPDSELLEAYREIIREVYMDVAPAAGAKLLLERAHRQGRCCVLVTSSLRALAKDWLLRWKLDSYFTHMVCGEDVVRGKPDPEPYLLALKRADCTAIDSIALEDSIQGARAAIGAGIPTWLVGTEAISDFDGQSLYLGRLNQLELAL